MSIIETIDLNDKQSMLSYSKVAGVKGEQYISGIRFVLPEGYETWSVFVDIENPSKEKYRQEILATNDGTIIYEFTAQDLAESGRLFMDLVLVDPADEPEGDDELSQLAADKLTHIYKPFRGEFSVRKSICASDDPSSETTTVITSEVKDTIVALLDIYKNHDLGIIDKVTENDDGELSFNGEPYITKEDSVKIAVEGEILKITFGPQGSDDESEGG